MSPFPFVQATDFDFMTDPPDEEIGQQIFVLGDTGRASRRAYARVNVFGDNEWYEDGDITMVPLLTHTTFTDVGSGDVDIAGPVAIDGFHFKEFRLVAYVMGAGNTAKIRMIGLDTNGITWTDLGDTTGLLFPNSVDRTYSEWTGIASNFWWPTTAKAVIYDGDGTEDVELGALVLHLRR